MRFLMQWAEILREEVDLVITVDNLSKVYSNGKGVFDVSLEVSEGEVFGFLGPNGAGKTTTIRVLLGFTNATNGSCSINGLDCRTQASDIQKQLGYVPGEIAFFDNMTGTQFLKFMTEMRSTKGTKRRDELIELFELDGGQSIRKMSKGTKQKLGLVAAFMHDPAILILDEPTSGLDPLMQRRFIGLIREESKRGKTILMSSHLFDEVDRTCERVAIIREGRIVALEDIASLKSSIRKSYTVGLAGDADIEKIKASGLEYHLVNGNLVEIFISNDYGKLLSTLADCTVTSLDASAQSLEQVFIRYYGKDREAV